ncbi:Uncharacterised protein [Prescottella equi]|nr:Uncharacterised protein [Prescottella equi]SUE18105.1 Uncharacterised protein [Prescottella equi]
MSILRQGTTVEPQSLLERIADSLQPGGPLRGLTGAAEALELIVETARGTVLADLERLVALEIAAPRGGMWISDGPWPTSDGFYLAATAARFEQLLDSVQALATLHRAGMHRAGWAVLEQAGKTLMRLWMFTETTVLDQPWDEARRSGQAWGQFTEALHHLDGVTGFEPHPFDAPYTDEASEDAKDSLHEAMAGASDHAEQVVNAIRLGAALALVHLPAHLQIGPEAVTAMPTARTGLPCTEMLAAQIQLAVELIRSAAASTQCALDISLRDRNA